MKTKLEVLKHINQLIIEHPDELALVQPIQNFLNQFDDEEIYSRTNFTGHITASAFIFNPATRSFLLIHHSTLNRWLQPGGHVELSDESLQTAALREAVEETGLPAGSFILHENIFDIDSHNIPFNTKKNEPAHVHHDVRFLFTCTTAVGSIQAEHVSGCEWISIDNMPVEQSFNRVKAKALKM